MSRRKPEDFRAELMKQDEPEAREIALAIELFTHGSLNTFAKQTNVDTNNRLICYDILDLGKEKALYDTGVSAEYGDKLITLSTCEYSNTNGRLVLVAKRIVD